MRSCGSPSENAACAPCLTRVRRAVANGGQRSVSAQAARKPRKSGRGEFPMSFRRERGTAAEERKDASGFRYAVC
jgi:hypothetical protein